MRQCLRVKGGRSLGDDTLVLGAVGVVEGTVVEMGVVEAAEGEAKQRLLDEAREVRCRPCLSLCFPSLPDCHRLFAFSVAGSCH